jgi:tetratricopeptide (TPR) repeat protein
MTSRRQRLEIEQAELQKIWDDKMELLTRLRHGFAIESSTSMKFQLEKQVESAATELAQLGSQLEKLEQDLYKEPSTKVTSLDQEYTATSQVRLEGGEPNIADIKNDTFKKTILILPASRESTASSRWGEEITKIRGAVGRGDKGDGRFEVQDKSYANSSNLSEVLGDVKPYIVHICGCADGINGLVFSDTNQSLHDNIQNQRELIARLFERNAKSVSCLVLSGCSSGEQIKEIIQHIEFVISITADLGEIRAANFLSEFYYQLTLGEGIKDSFGSGCDSIQREEYSDESTLPRLSIRSDEIKRRFLEEELHSCDLEIEQDPNNIKLWKKRASLLKDLGRTDEANDAYEKASSLEPGNYNIRVQQGDALEQLGEHEKANFAYDKALEIEEADYKVWWKKARTLTEAGKNIEAVNCYEKAIALSPDNYVILTEYGVTLSKLEHFYEAATSYKRALYIQPNYRVANYNKKQAYKKMYIRDR